MVQICWVLPLPRSAHCHFPSQCVRTRSHSPPAKLLLNSTPTPPPRSWRDSTAPAAPVEHPSAQSLLPGPLRAHLPVAATRVRDKRLPHTPMYPSHSLVDT